MSNICDYIKWRGDLTLEQSEFNEIDNLILSRFSYFPFDNIMEENETVTIRELSERFEKTNISEMQILWKDDIKLFPLMGKSRRFGNMVATKYINKINIEQEKQFSAITILMPDNTIYVSYRGTDNTLVGWKEDFNMSFKSHVASQLDSIKYLEEVSKKYKNKLRVGGHSKGGNLAVYASIFCDPKVKNRIINIYNNDGPGFGTDIIETKEYKQIVDKIHTFIPQSSIIGRLLNHQEKHTIVYSTQRGIMQHDLYSWQLIGNQFKYIDEMASDSEFVDKAIKEWLEDVEPERREKVIDVLFEVLYTTESETFTDMKENWFMNTKIILKSYKDIDNETKKIITQTLQSLFKIMKTSIFKEFPRLPAKSKKK